MEKHQIWFWCGTFWIFASIILFIVLLSVTVNQAVAQNEYVVGYNNYTQEFTKIYSQGKYTIDVGELFIPFTRTVQEFNSDIDCLTQDKVEITLTFAIQYQYQEDYLIPIILQKFGNNKNYKNWFQASVYSSIQESSLKFNAIDYYSQRGTVDSTMYNDLVVNINKLVLDDSNMGTLINFFQLVNIKFPTSFSTIIQQKQNIQQSELTATNNRTSLITNANTQLLEAQRTADIIILNANYSAIININEAEALANVELQKWTNRAIAYSQAKDNLNFNASQMVQYLKSENLRNSNKLFTDAN
jgi:regulator of protease activity HflC (stomatin/prohibitin superfamily)